jgi:hypothetical protein
MKAMDEHERLQALAPLYVAGQLDGSECQEFEQHLAGCAECQADYAMWAAVFATISTANQAVTAPPALAERALGRVHTRPPLQTAFLRAWQLLGAQARLVQHELWPACAAVMAIGVAVALLAEKAGVIQFIAPMVAAASLAILYGPEHDPATELALATPTSPWKILLARLALVSGYNLLLALLASLALLALVPPNVFGALVLGWLGPLAFLSALALLLSLWIGTGNAVMLVYSLWLAQYIRPTQALGIWQWSPVWEAFFSAYQRFWQNPLLLLTFSLLLLGIALMSANRSRPRLPQGIA